MKKIGGFGLFVGDVLSRVGFWPLEVTWPWV